MDKKFKKIIAQENEKNPYTDDELSELLSIHRVEICELRKRLDIPNSRERRKPILIRKLKNILKDNPNISDRNLCEELNLDGFKVSRFLVNSLRKEVGEDILSNKIIIKQDKINFKMEKDDFKGIIGLNGSLRTQIQQAKAAVLYPPTGLHTLIIGPTGAGKSLLAEGMYKFALDTKRISNDSRFIRFNCADYSDNPQLLLSQLFGYVKGSFTGADSSKEGVVEKADGGILFLDEIHRLPPEGQEILFFLIDKGQFRRLGETESERKSNILLIAATNANIESSLLLTFRRRIPMLIELPTLKERPIKERHQLVKYFLNKEASRTKLPIILSEECLRTLLLYECTGNIGQLRSDIQVACARGFFNCISSEEKEIHVDIIELPQHVRKTFLQGTYRKINIDKYTKGKNVFYPDDDIENIDKNSEEDFYVSSQKIYHFIEEKYIELKNKGISTEKINKVIGVEIEGKFNSFLKKINTNYPTINKENLVSIAGKEMVEISEKMVKVAQDNMNNIDHRLLNYISIHLSSTIDRIRNKKNIINPNLDYIKNTYKFEYDVASKMVKVIEKELNIFLSEDEISFIALYLKSVYREKENNKGRVRVVILTHGRVAQGMADVANTLLETNDFVKAIEMSLDEPPKLALERAEQMIKQINEGKGVLLMVDMGSLVTFGEIITNSTKIPTRIVRRVDTIKVLEGARRALISDTTLEEIVESLDESEREQGRLISNTANNKKKSILAICITGQGSAEKIKNLISNMLPSIEENVKIIPIGAMHYKDLNKRINEIMQNTNVVTIVGTVKPYGINIPFISLEEIIDGKATDALERMVGSSSLKNQVQYLSELYNTMDKDLIFTDVNFNSKHEVIDFLSNKILQKGYVTKDFILDAYKREVQQNTLIEGNVAIPHGYPQNVKQPTISIAILRNKIKWAEVSNIDNMVDVVIMLALDVNSEHTVRGLYELVSDNEMMAKVRVAKDNQEIVNIIKNSIK